MKTKIGNRKMITFIVMLLLIIAANLTSCAGKTGGLEIIPNTISSMSGINSFKLDMNLVLTNTASGNTESPIYFNKWQWKSQRQFDLIKKEMQVSMNSGDGTTINIWDAYLVDGWEYFHTISPLPQPADSLAWFKTKLSENNRLFVDEAQISPLVDLLKTATKASLVGLENVDGTECYVLQITPSQESLANWVISQQQPAGLDLSELATASAEYVKGYQNSWIRIWIEKDGFLIKRVDINVFFSIKQSIRDFQGQMNFSSYNNPISISVPPDATSAPQEH